ncbi:MAG TPA: tetratricopeptide repeat protein, partial [bacterium]|nr:tetratricopeptide repeat protein [bacterium]
MTKMRTAVGVLVLLLLTGVALADTARDLARGNALLALKSYAEAMEVFRAVTGADPQNRAAWQGLAQAAEGAADNEEAIRAYQQVIELTPGQLPPELLVRLAGVYVTVRRYDEALPLYEKLHA